jgi:hypothetical protein
MEIIQKATPETLDELERGFKPIEYREGDYTGLQCYTLGLQLGISGRFRVAVVYAVSNVDANKIVHIAKVLGPGTGEPMLSVPCGGNVEWAWVQEAMEYRRSTLHERRIKRALRVQEWQANMNRQLIDVADNLDKKKRGLSTFGEAGKLQRTSS